MASTHPTSGEIRLATEEPFEIGPLRVRPALGEIEAEGIVERLEPRVMQVLVALASRPTQVVTREELRLRCWGQRTVSEDALNRPISRLRAVAARRGKPFEIENRSRIGYRLMPTFLPMLAEQSGVNTSPRLRPPGPHSDAEPERSPASQGAELLRARAIVALEQPSREQIEQACAYLSRAVAMAPQFAEAWCSLAEAQRLQMLYYPPLRQPPRITQSRASAQRALELQPDIGEAYGVLANLLPRYNQWREVEATFRRGLSTRPANGMLRQEYARFLLSVGRTSEAVEILAALQAENPLNTLLTVELASALFDIEQHREALACIDAAHRLWPGIVLVWSERIRLHLMAGHYELAQSLLEDPPAAVRPGDENVARRKLHLQASRSGDRELCDAARQNFEAFARTGLGPAIVAVHALTTLGKTGAALDVAESIFRRDAPQSRRIGVNMMGTYALAGQADTKVLFRADTASMRGSPRFHAILSEIGLTDYWQASGSRPGFSE